MTLRAWYSAAMSPSVDPAIRYHAKVDQCGPDECWLWTGSRRGRQEYGQYGGISVNGRLVGAHRFGYELLVGPIPDGLYVLHRCDTPLCQNPSHWFLGTPKDNSQDREQKGRHIPARGEQDGNAKLTEAGVLEIRRLYVSGTSQYVLAEMFSVTQATISQIVLHKTWTHLAGVNTRPPVYHTKLVESDIRQIRQRYTTGETQQALAAAFSVSQGCILKVVHRRTWKHVCD